jgi:hypothetical protein
VRDVHMEGKTAINKETEWCLSSPPGSESQSVGEKNPVSNK